MSKFLRFLSAAAIALPCGLAFTPEFASAATGTFTFDDIHYWVGEGTNKAAIVIDWNNGLPGSSIAYGYRWNGTSANMAAVLRELEAEDRRLHVGISQSPWGSSMDAFGYDSNGDGGAFDLVEEASTDPADFIGVYAAPNYWQSLHANSAAFPENAEWGYFGVGLDGQFPTNGQWIAYRHIDWNIWPAPPMARPMAAESPYAFNVVEFESDPDFTRGYDFPEAALGRPAPQTPADHDHGLLPVPLTPFMPAWGTGNIVSLCDYEDLPGYITIEFDHPVVDDPNNPWGLDFIVFGNSFYSYGGADYLTGFENPTNAVVGDGMVAEPGIVEVSQDGTTWFTSPSRLDADALAPTLGYKLDPENANTNLFEGNKWWGAKADPTYPVPPHGEGFIAQGTSLAQIATWYNGSAGGAAFDISELDLPATHNGVKWFRYVRITNSNPDLGAGLSSCEIDAVADVYPDTPYGLYAKERYDWTELPSAGRKTAIGSNGRPNFVNFALGENPAAKLEISGFEVRDGRLWFSFPVWNGDWNINDLLDSGIEFGPRGKSDLASGAFGNTTPGFARSEGLVTNAADGTYTATISVEEPSRASKAFFRLGISAED